MDYVFDKLRGGYTLVRFVGVAGDVEVLRGATITAEQFERLTPESKAHVRAAVKAGFVSVVGTDPQAVEPATDAAPRRRGKE